MTATAVHTHGRTRAPGADARYVVRVSDVVDERIAGHHGCNYASPAQPRGDALALAALLLGGSLANPDGRETWTRTVAIAGGRRTVTLERAAGAP